MKEYDISFLEGYYPLESLASFAIQYVESDSNSSVIKQGMMLEHIIKVILQNNNLYFVSPKGEKPSLNEMIQLSDSYGLLPSNYNARKHIDELRRERNFAVHEFLSSSDIARKHLDFILAFSKWFMQNWARHRALVYYSDGGTGYSVFMLKQEFRLSSILWNFPLELPLEEKESTLDYSKRVLASFSYDD